MKIIRHLKEIIIRSEKSPYKIIIRLATYLMVSRSDIGEFSMRPQERRLRRKWSHTPYNLVNFISVNWESEVGQGWQQGEEKTRQKKKG